MNILGISAGFHDAAVTVIQNDEIIFAGHSERYSKIKHDPNLCSALLADAILESGAYPHQIAYYERPWVKKTRQLYAGQYSELTKGWSVRNMISDAAPWFNHRDIPLKTYNHHLSHAAAGFQTSPFDDATVVVIDAIGEWDTISIWSAKYVNGRAEYTRVWRQLYPHSIGLMYSAFTKEVGLKPLDEEYILMGMAGWAQKNTGRLSDELSTWLIEHEFDLTLKHNLHVGLPDNDMRARWNDFEIAAAAQTLTEQLIHNIMYKAMKLSPNSNLVYCGGVALNCSANRDLGEYFDEIWIMPNPGDAGSSLGAAALAHGGRLNWNNAFLGHNISGSYPVTDVVSELMTNKIVGVASGRAEFGPRALGNRSLLADPRGPDIKDAVNQIKRRQKFRPFAPIILEEFVDEYFEMPNGFATSRYMQTTAKCLRPDEFPAIIHVDGTSRVQTVPRDGSGIRELLCLWYTWTGCPMLLNTSLNIRGEPMVNDRADADRFEELYGIKVLS
jgi:carbamoyltransferase